MHKRDQVLQQEKIEALLGPIDGHYFKGQYSDPEISIRLLSDLGKKRQNNEDSCMLYVPGSEALTDSRGILVAVADGMGGAKAGEYASHNALRCICPVYYERNPHALVPAALRQAVEAANAFVFRESEHNIDFSGMGTTVSALAIVGNWAYIAQVGDSRIYLLRSGMPLKQLTYDHTLVAEQIKNGLINEEEARNHSLKNLITRAVGIRDTVDVDLFALELQPHDTLLLCSDGLTNMVNDENLEKELAQEDLTAMSESLLEKALEAGGTDNITMILVRIGEVLKESNYQQGGRIISFHKKSALRRLFSFFS
jgi:protein phosphatase